MMNLSPISLAQMFSHAAHDSIGQIRKYTGEPYWVHTNAVAATVAEFSGSVDMVCAAHLHDVLEDVVTPYNIDEFGPFQILDEFGHDVLSYVVELTDLYTSKAYPNLNRVERKRLEKERIAKVSDGAKLIKLADLIDNITSIVVHDADFARVYLKEKEAMLAVLLTPFTGEIHKKALTSLEESFRLLIVP